MFIYLFLGWILSSFAGKELDRKNKDIHKDIMNIGKNGEIWRKELREKRLKEIEDYLAETNKENK